jgi:hypothetical protein
MYALLFIKDKNALPVYSRPHKVFVGILLLYLSVWADKDAFVLPKLEIEVERRFQGKISKQRR